VTVAKEGEWALWMMVSRRSADSLEEVVSKDGG
jgi:hypothetical protein